MMRVRSWLPVLVGIAAMATILFLIAGDGQGRDVVKVNLDKRVKISPVQRVSTEIQRQVGDDSLRVAVSGVLSPSMTLEYYKDLLGYMERELEWEVALILKPTYAEINDLVEGQRVDLAFVCSLAYVEGSDDFGMELLVAPQMYGESVYYSYLIVSAESDTTGLEDLRGASFAFTDPMSNTGRLAPTYQLSLLNEFPASFFSRHIFTYSHDNSILAVADRLIEGAAVDSLVYDQLVTENPELTSKTKIISRWGPYGIPPVVTSPELDSQLKQQLQDFFLDLNNHNEGVTILNNLAIDKFVIVPDNAYNSIREMNVRVGW